jgi:CheY-like chemotaxis protein
MDQQAAKRDVERRLARGEQFPDFPDGPVIEQFDPLALAEALEQQATRAKIVFDVPKVDMRMGADDALALARWLRQAPRRA